MKTLLSLILMVTFSSYAHARGKFSNVFGELYVGSDQSKITATALTPPNMDAKNSGLAGGLRGGVKSSVLMAGVDVQLALGNADFEAASEKDGPWSKRNVYVFAGFDFDRIRLWGAYSVDQEYKLSQTEGLTTTESKLSGGGGYKAGASIRLFQGLHINGEYYVNTPKNVEVNGTVTELDTLYSKWQESGVIISLSWALEPVKGK